MAAPPLMDTNTCVPRVTAVAFTVMMSAATAALVDKSGEPAYTTSSYCCTVTGESVYHVYLNM